MENPAVNKLTETKNDYGNKRLILALFVIRFR